jgi:formate dehydrogenase
MEQIMAKVLCVLYDDPVDGYPASYPRDDLPKIGRYPDGQLLPTPKAIDFEPGTLFGSISGELGLREYLESNGHSLTVTSIRMARTRSSSESCRTRRLLSRSRFGPPI